MARNIQHKWVDKQVDELLNLLIDMHTSSSEYANTMYQLGRVFGQIIERSLSSTDDRRVTLACTVEDADYLANGIINVLESNNTKVFLTVFWNKRFKPNTENNISIAPILREFHEPNFKSTKTIIVLKSIIANSCVVRTNLTRLIEELSPEEIFIVAPVLLEGAQKKLEAEFNSEISKKFQYIYFAEDNEKTDDGIVVPGIGGDVYQRLGFTNQADKNKFVPEIVKRRRHVLA